MNVEREYRARVDAMSVAERVRRAEVLFNWSREFVARSILDARGPISTTDLAWNIAFRHYGADPKTRAWLDELRSRAAT